MIIAFIHLVVLGVVSLGLIAILLRVGWFSIEPWRSKFGMAAFLVGLAGTELLLIAPVTGLVWAAHFQWLFWLSVVMAGGILLFWAGNLMPKRR